MCMCVYVYYMYVCMQACVYALARHLTGLWQRKPRRGGVNTYVCVYTVYIICMYVCEHVCMHTGDTFDWTVENEAHVRRSE